MKSRVLVLNDTSIENHHGCEIVMNNLHDLLTKNNFEILHTIPVGVSWKKYPKFDSLVERCQLVVVNGEGTIHHSNEYAKDLVEVAKHAGSLGVPSVLINCTYQENDPEFFKPLLSEFSLITVRESFSKAELDRINIDSEVVPDLTFYNSQKFIVDQKLGGRIRITDSTYWDLSKRLLSISTKMKFDFIPIERDKSKELHHPLKTLRRILTKRDLINPLVVGRNLISFLRQLIKRQKNEYKYIATIQSSKMVVIARFHALCFSIFTKTPFVCIASNSHKIEGILSDVGVYDRMIDLNELEVGQLDSYSEFTEEEISNIIVYLNEANRKIESVFERLAAIVIINGERRN